MEIKIKVKNENQYKREILTLGSRPTGLERAVNVTYPKWWSLLDVNEYIKKYHDSYVRKPFLEDVNTVLMKNNLEKIKRLGYRVVAVDQKYGCIVRKDGKFLSYSLAPWTTDGGICLAYDYKPSRAHGTGASQGTKDSREFGYCDFTNKMIDRMMDSPRIPGKVECYKDFGEYCQSRHNSVLRKFIEN